MLYSISETARLLKVSVSLIKVKIKEGVITPKEIIGNKGTRYFTREEIERFGKTRNIEFMDCDFMTYEELLVEYKKLINGADR